MKKNCIKTKQIEFKIGNKLYVEWKGYDNSFAR